MEISAKAGLFRRIESGLYDVMVIDVEARGAEAPPAFDPDDRSARPLDRPGDVVRERDQGARCT